MEQLSTVLLLAQVPDKSGLWVQAFSTWGEGSLEAHSWWLRSSASVLPLRAESPDSVLLTFLS